MELCPLSGKPCCNKRTYHITEVEKDQVRAIDLCEECVAIYLEAHNLLKHPKPVQTLPALINPQPLKQDPETMIKKSIVDLFQYIAESISKRHLSTPACPSCGQTHKDIRDTGKLGCGDCYNYFEKLIPMILMTHHKALKHVGKVPKSFQKKALPNAIQKAEEEMKEAIEQEDYEKAATLRDSITALKDQLPSE